MPRAARIVVPGASHHITQRGNNRQAVFFSTRDCLAYLDFLKEYSSRFNFRVEGYCLMPNHVHVVGVPESEDSLAAAIGRTHLQYSRNLNRTRGRSGHIWQSRFYSCAMDEGHAINAMCYVELNPVRAGFAANPWDFKWSSAAAHCGLETKDSWLDLSAWRTNTVGPYWRETLTEVARNKGLLDAVRRSTRSGRPLGNDDFLRQIGRWGQPPIIRPGPQDTIEFGGE